MTQNTSVGGPLAGLFGSSDGAINTCMEFTIDKISALTITFDLLQPETVSAVFLQMQGTLGSLTTVDVTLYDSSGAAQACSTMSLGATKFMSSDCTNQIGTRIELTLWYSNTAELTVQNICKIVAFGLPCSSYSTTLTFNSFDDSMRTFELTEDTYQQILLPDYTAPPTGCYTLTWRLHRLSDGLDMGNFRPDFYQILAGSQYLELLFPSNTVWWDRVDFYGLETFYFEGTLSDTALTKTSRHNFQIDFTDNCRTATIIPQSIVYPPVKWNTDLTSSLTVIGF